MRITHNDCAIKLLVGATLPTSLYSFTVPKRETIIKYIMESLAAGLGRGFFLVSKKDGFLQPCIDYWSLNAIIRLIRLKKSTPCLCPALLSTHYKKTLFLLNRTFRIPTILCIFVRGRNWKTAFNTPMVTLSTKFFPSDAPVVLRALLNNVLRDPDSILVYSASVLEHSKQVYMVLLDQLLQNRRYFKAEKCKFHQQPISFLDFSSSPGC